MNIPIGLMENISCFNVNFFISLLIEIYPVIVSYRDLKVLYLKQFRSYYVLWKT